MPPTERCLPQTTHVWQHSADYTADVREDTFNSPPSFGSLFKSGAPGDKAFHIVMPLILTGLALYAALNLGLMVSKNYIIEACISRWEMELQSFDLGPAPSWLDDPPQDFLHLPAGANKYADFSLSLLLKNNPPWLGVELSSVGIFIFEGALVHLRFDDTPVNEDGTVSIIDRVPLVDVTELPYICLLHASATEHLMAFTLILEAKFSLFGQGSNTFKLKTDLIYDTSGGDNYGMHRDLSARGEWIAQVCRRACNRARVPTVRHHYGKVAVEAVNYVSNWGCINLSSLYEVSLRFRA
ncbi:hypothetical protein FOZ60_003693 [Perkinsus olseni]|uniref:Uncharacterized protein n=2 Tax=Perkinsus olseni TaxID=32597 RepID=A0A7J6PJP6_PEROL|nr:hypothetical protein FOZ60_003693 [Perkinsus olseni]